MKKIWLVLAILMLTGLLFAAPSREAASGGELRFAWWGNPVRDERTEQLIELFERRNPGVIVEAEPTGWAGYWDRMNTLAAAGNLPDVMQQDISYIRQFTDRNQLEVLTPFVDRGLINLTHWDEGGLSAGVVNGKLVGLLLGTNAWAMLVDPAVIQRAGVTIDDTTWTWADYERIATQIHQRTGVQSWAPATWRQTFEHIGRQMGTGFFTTDDRNLGISANQAALNAVRNYLEMELRLNAAGVMFDPEENFIQGLAMPEEPLARGRTWNNGAWSNQLGGHQSGAGRPLQMLMWPTVQGNRAPFGLYFRPSMYISMLASSQNKDLSARFIDFFVNDIEANRILMAERGVPIPTNVRNDLYPRVDAVQQDIFNYITKITPFISPTDLLPPPTAGEVEAALRAIVLQCMTGRLTVDAALQQMIQTAHQIMTR